MIINYDQEGHFMNMSNALVILFFKSTLGAGKL